MDITKKMKLFSKFLNKNWMVINVFLHPDKHFNIAKNDFIQGNWELLLETSLDVFLPPFGEGADINGISSRVTYPNKEATHLIYGKLNKDKVLCLYSGNFKTDLSGYYLEVLINDKLELSPPFNYAKFINLNQDRIIVPLKSISFYIVKIGDDNNDTNPTVQSQKEE